MSRLILAVIVAISGAACAAAPTTAPAKPLLLHLPGIAGPRAIDDNLVNGLTDGGIGAEISMFDWTGGRGGLAALMAYKKNREQAQKLSEQLAQQIKTSPARPIYLTGHSGGAAVLVWALEFLPAGTTVDSILLLAPALSPTYDLSKALAHVKGKAHVFYSPNDGIVLGTGTKVFGTMDGVNTDAAGKVGFTRPDTADENAYAKLIAHPYEPKWNAEYGNNGDHIGVMSRRFASGLLAGVLRSTGPTTRIADGEPTKRSANQ